ncbi:rod shape-determining protein MreD [Candidatus Binatia bacterium]|jgi:rod shape-determining protein MreD|nr:rod shape-determining protein MreD [Candidatus Binatia bacterium]
MRSLLIFAMAGVLAVVVQTTLVQRLGFLPAAPDLIVTLCVYLGLHYHTAAGALGAFLLGYLLDTFSGAVPGLYCLTMTLVFGMVYLVSKRLWMENPMSNIAAVALGSAVKIVTVVLYFAIVATRSVNWWFVLRTLMLEALLALLCAPAVFAALDSYLPRSARQHAAE